MSANLKGATKELGIFSLTILLVSAHYGLGFLLGTAEQAMHQGIEGSLYGLSIGWGFLALLLLVKFYWQQVEPIWTLLGNRYGKSLQVGVALMSWLSLVGIEAVQILAGAAILAVVGLAKLTSILVLALLFGLLSLLLVEKVSWILRGLLLLNILELVYSLWVLQGWSIIAQSPAELLRNLAQIAPGEEIGIFLGTILLVMLDMKCHQYLVRAKDVGTAIWGCFLTAIILMALALLAGATVTAARQAGILPPNLEGQEVLPYLLAWVNGGREQGLGLVAVATLAVPALGLGSSVLRVQTQTWFALELVTQGLSQRIVMVVINVLVALTVALRGGEIVGLILLFYAAYLSATVIPFLAYLLDYWAVYTCGTNSVKLSLLMGSVSALVSILLMLVRPEAVMLGSAQLTIILLGLGLASTTLVGSELVAKLLLALAVKKEHSEEKT